MSRILWYNEGEQKRRPRAVTLAAVDKRTVHLMNDNTSKTIEIPLTKGYVAIVDECDADLLGFKWFPAIKNSKVYVWRKTLGCTTSEKQTIHLHRVVFERMENQSLISSQLVDHKDNNPLNNTRQNLRLADKSKNAMNSKRRSDNTSGFKGVGFHKQTGKWVATIRANGKKHSLGLHLTPEEAYAAYCKAAKEFFGEFARTE